MDNNLEKLRKSAHLTQHKLGKQLGLSQQVISRIERDISTITLEHLLLLADFYQVSILTIFLTVQRQKEVGKNSRLSVRFWKNTMNWFGRWRCLMNVILVSYGR